VVSRLAENQVYRTIESQVSQFLQDLGYPSIITRRKLEDRLLEKGLLDENRMIFNRRCISVALMKKGYCPSTKGHASGGHCKNRTFYKK